MTENPATQSQPASTGEQVVCVYCASSQACHSDYHAVAYRLGELFADAGWSIIYGGGAVGSMGALANGALSKRGRVVGVIPKFMVELEWEHPGITELLHVEDMRTRKHIMLSRSNAVVALPGGTGTLEELFEAMTLKRLGLYFNPIVIVNTRGFYDPLLELLSRTVSEKFMGERHALMWHVVNHPEEVLPAISAITPWPQDAIHFAAQR